jgi:saccharopine dehydrogenase-like NADP-dependent oxidoreductase
MKSILVLGAGRIAGPCVQYLLRCEDFHVTVVDISEENIRRVTRDHPRSQARVITPETDPAELIGSLNPDLVLCLLPPSLMAPVARECIRTGTHMVHPAYLDDELRAMGADVKASGAVFIAELGLDPGIDHMSAAKTIRRIHEKGGQVESFRSICGAIPSAEANTNPWGYKLSWAPACLIGANRRTARIMVDGREITWADGETYEKVILEEIEGMGCYEVYANADSIPYIETYGIPEVKSIYRGTLRYPGWCETVCKMNSLGLVDEAVQDFEGVTFGQFMARQAGAGPDEDPEKAVCRRLGLEPYSTVMLRFKWLGLFDDSLIPFAKGSARDIIAFLYDRKFVYEPHEKDLIILRDEYVAFYPESGKRVKYLSTLIDFGIPGEDTSIARTTGIPPAIAARFILEGKITTPGLHTPVLPEIYEPVLAELENENITLKEETRELDG